MKNIRLLLKILGELVFTETSESWLRLTEEERVAVLADAENAGVELFFYCFLTRELPSGVQQKYSNRFLQKNLFLQSRYEPVYRSFTAILKEKQVPYVPLKSVCFGYAIYPHPFLRLRGDMDVLLPPEAAQEMHRYLKTVGATAYGGLPDGHKHLTALSWRGQSLEIHTHLFSDYPGRCSTEQLWAHCIPNPEDPGRYDLEPELHWLMRVRNIYEDRWKGILRMLLDLAYLQKKYDISPARLTELNRELNLQLDLSFPFLATDFWPESQRLFPHDFPEDKIRNDFLAMFSQEPGYTVIQTQLIECTEHRSLRKSVCFFCGKLWIPPRVIRARYKIPDNRLLPLIPGYFRDIRWKVGKTLQFFRDPTPAAQKEHVRRLQRLDQTFWKNR